MGVKAIGPLRNSQPKSDCLEQKHISIKLHIQIRNEWGKAGQDAHLSQISCNSDKWNLQKHILMYCSLQSCAHLLGITPTKLCRTRKTFKIVVFMHSSDISLTILTKSLGSNNSYHFHTQALSTQTGHCLLVARQIYILNHLNCSSWLPLKVKLNL